MHVATLLAATSAGRPRARALWAVAGGLLALAGTPILASWTQALTCQQQNGWWRPHRTDRAQLAVFAAVAVSLSVAAAFCDPQPVWLAFALVGSVLMIVDVRALLLPARLVYPATAVDAVLLLTYALTRHQPDRLVSCLVAASVVGGCWITAHVLAPAALGRGDVRLATWTAGLLGWHGWHAVVLGQFGAAALLSLTGLLVAGAACGIGLARPSFPSARP